MLVTVHGFLGDGVLFGSYVHSRTTISRPLELAPGIWLGPFLDNRSLKLSEDQTRTIHMLRIIVKKQDSQTGSEASVCSNLMFLCVWYVNRLSGLSSRKDLSHISGQSSGGLEIVVRECTVTHKSSWRSGRVRTHRVYVGYCVHLALNDLHFNDGDTKQFSKRFDYVTSLNRLAV